MENFDAVALVLSLSAAFAYVNKRWLGFPQTVGLLILASLSSVAIVVFGKYFGSLDEQAQQVIRSLDFSQVLMHGMLSFLLFAGSLHIDLGSLVARWKVISLLATIGVVASTVLVGLVSWSIFRIVGLDVSLVYCLIFGALISPTDPVAVLGILKSSGAPESLRIKIAGESLFNDGMGVVVFLLLVDFLSKASDTTLIHVVSIFVPEALGGILYGLLLGWLGFRLLKSIDDHHLEVLITLALVSGGYSLARLMHVSGPLAMVVSGLFVGNHGRLFAMSDKTREHVDVFWSLIDEVLNAVLFVLIGFEILLIQVAWPTMIAGFLIIVFVLFVRYLCVAGVLTFLRRWSEFSPHAALIMAWCGLRGGISIAMVLSLPPGSERDILLTVTWVVVAFSIAVQGLTVKPLVRRLLGN